MSNTILLLVLLLPLLTTGHCPLPTADDIEEELKDLLHNADSAGGSIDPKLSSYNYTCLAQGSTRDTYRRVSIIATFTRNSIEVQQTQHFQLQCNSGKWDAETNQGFETPPSNPMERRDCRTCVPENLGGDSNHCLECSETCRSMGQGSCLSSITDCCPYFGLDDMCTISCPTNYSASAHTNFICVCNYTCGPGEMAYSTCNGCNLTDICLRDKPCQNGGSCILLSAPDNHTCDCSGTGYMGTNCNNLILSTHHSPSPTPAPPLILCSLNGCKECENSTCCKSCDNGYNNNDCICISSTVPTPSCIALNCKTCYINRPNCCNKCVDGFSLSDSSRCKCEVVVSSSTVVLFSTPPSETPITVSRDGSDTGPLVYIGIILVGVIIGILVLLVLAAITAYVIYYFVTRTGTVAAVKKSGIFIDGNVYNNPLYINPDETSNL